MMRDIEAKRAALKAEMMNLQALINGRAQELADLKRQALRLDERLAELALQECTRRRIGLDELVRMCQTPCSRFVPVDPEHFGYGVTVLGEDMVLIDSVRFGCLWK
jgi:hypothetical protein